MHSTRIEYHIPICSIREDTIQRDLEVISSRVQKLLEYIHYIEMNHIDIDHIKSFSSFHDEDSIYEEQAFSSHILYDNSLQGYRMKEHDSYRCTHFEMFLRRL